LFPSVIGYVVCWIVMPVAPLPAAAPVVAPSPQSTQTA